MRWWLLSVALVGASASPPMLGAQVKAVSVSVVMLSDIHFDPFHDPAKLPQLREKPVQEWAALLRQADSPTRVQDVAALQKACPVHGVDTDWALLESSLKAAHAQEPKPAFVTMSGDLLAHAFNCRFKLLTPGADETAYGVFAAKTAAFVALELREAFAGVPVYLALGNNDSGCGDYRENVGSEFLRSVGGAFADDVDARNRKAVAADFSAEGDYSVELPLPMQHARLIVLQDLFESKRYKHCSKDAAPGANVEPAEIQLAWLRTQLAAAKVKHENVWVMAHIPPGVDVYSTYTKKVDVCGGQTPQMFLGSEKMAEVLTEYAPEVKLAIFAHTHMDEMRLLHGSGNAEARVPAKLVASISPVNGNEPSFTVARVDPRTATMLDYSLYAGSYGAGVTTVWNKAYDFGVTYGLRDFSAQSLNGLFAGFLADKNVAGQKTQAYVRNFFVGGNLIRQAELQFGWSTYSCSMTENTEAGFRRCACP